jgi:ketol-acid reductoisomerase
LRDAAAQSLETAYAKARSYAATETGISEETFPRECSYSLEQILDDNFLPRD